MKIAVEFSSKEELDAFFTASEQGTIEAAQSVYLVNMLGQTCSVRMTTREDEPGAAVVEIYQRGQAPEGQPFAAEAALKIV